MSVVICSAGVALMTAGYATAQSATQQAKEKTKAAAEQAADVTTDAAITSAVKTKLLADSKVGGLKIDVDTKDGVVTLSGKVQSAAERAEAVRLARTTKGVKRVKSDLVLEAVATSGKTESKTEKMKEETKETAHKAKTGTKHAAEKTEEVVTDAAITTAVKTKLLADTTVGGLKIDVDTSNGVVTLTGPVHSVAERTQAVKLARGTHGVKNVVNKLTVEPK